MIDPKTQSTEGKNFTAKDVVNDRIVCMRDDLIYNPPQWMKDGRQETASGYGKRLNSGYSIRYYGKVYRVYVTCFSNAGTAWFTVKNVLGGKTRIVVSAH